MSQFFKVLLCHSPKEDGKYRQMETVYHLHGDTDGYDNHRCSLTEDGNYFCPGCKQTFDKEEVNRYPYRDLPKNKSYWLESRRSGQHLPHNEKDIFWSHLHPQDDLLKRKAAEVDFSGIFATCPVCEKMLNLHTWQESNPQNKQLVFPGIVMENVSVPIWKELKIFLEESVEIWLQDKDGNFFFLSNQLQLLPAENQEGILVCGDRLFLDNDDRKCLLFQVDEISQTLIDEHLKEALSSAEDFHLEIKMATEAEIPKRPESRRRSTKELSSGELAGLQTPPEREQSQEIIVIVDGEHTETHKIPRHYKVNLDEPTPLPEDAHPLLVTENVTSEESVKQDSWPPKMVVTIEQAEASGLIVLPENANADINENAMTADGGMLGNQLPDFTSDENDWFTSGEIHTDVENADVASEPTMALAEAPTAAVPNITNVADSRDGFAPTELAMTEQPVTDVEHTDVASEPTMTITEAPTAAATDHSLPKTLHSEPAMTESANTGTTDDPSPEPIPASGGTRQCIICGKMLRSSPLTGEEVCEEHEKSCFICATVNPKEAIFCGGCGSAFTKKSEKPATTPHPELKNVLTKIGLAVGMVGILVFVPMFFAWLINQFQREDLKAELQAAEKRRMELSSQTNKLRVEADLIRFDLLESKRDLGQVRNDIPILQAEQQKLAERQSELDNRLNNALSWEADLHAYFVKEKNLFGQYLAELGKNLRDEQKAWQKKERERSEQRYTELVKQFKSLATQPRETTVVAPPKTLFGGKPEQDKAETVVAVVPAKIFLDELMPALIELNKQLAKKYRNHKKAPPTLVVDKTPVTPPPQKLPQNTPPAVHKSAKDKVTAPVDKSKNPQKSAEKSPKNPQKTETSPTFEAKDLVHVWTGPTYF